MTDQPDQPAVQIPGPGLRMFLQGFEPGEPFVGPGEQQCTPLRFYSGGLIVEVIAATDDVEKVAREMLKAVTRARILEPTGIVTPNGSG